MGKRFIAQLTGDGDRWADVLYTSNRRKAQRCVDLAVKYNPRAKAGRVVDTTQEQERETEGRER